MNVHDRRVLITGGSRGIGRAVAYAFAQRGARVAIGFRRDEEAAATTLAQLPGEGHTMLQADVSDPEQAAGLVGGAVRALGGLDVLVGNAGVGGRHRVDEDDYRAWQEAWRRILAINLVGAANVAYHAGREMIEQGGGRMVFVSSRGAFRGEPDQPAYGASKAGLNAMAQSLAQQLGPHGIFVGVVAPGFVDTDLARQRLQGSDGEKIRAQSPLGRVATPEEVAHAVVFLASEGAEFTTGTILDVNGASYLRS